MTAVELFRQSPQGAPEKPAIPFSAAALTPDRSRRRSRSRHTHRRRLPFIHSPAAANRQRKERSRHQKNQKIFTNTLAVLPRSA
ncbi:hypothetical protein [Rhizobium chutanense]|uniref:hypothetical protein n=1 Tax=Rhizobium chutanense TaxID=2035448 RepID=UPI000F8842E7|nr:hypothetical protein [Rhizobium chutanense]